LYGLYMSSFCLSMSAFMCVLCMCDLCIVCICVMCVCVWWFVCLCECLKVRSLVWKKKKKREKDGH
jgi:hypothetical protein